MQETTANGLTAGQIQAATELVQAVLRKLKTEEGIHAETAVAAAARMAGSYLLRASGLPLDELSPGSPIAAEAQGAQVPELVAALEATLASFAISLDRAQVPAKIPEDNEAHH